MITISAVCFIFSLRGDDDPSLLPLALLLPGFLILQFLSLGLLDPPLLFLAGLSRQHHPNLFIVEVFALTNRKKRRAKNSLLLLAPF